jgi:hypothetical protein
MPYSTQKGKPDNNLSKNTNKRFTNCDLRF